MTASDSVATGIANQGTRGDAPSLRVLLVADNISLRLSGETSIPYYYLRHFLARGIEVRVICHARVRQTLRSDLPADVFERIQFVEDTWVENLLWRVGRLLHYRLEDLVVAEVIRSITQMRMRRVARKLIDAHRLNIIFQPTPISPKSISHFYGLGVPVVIGPMCGGLKLPRAFRKMDGLLVTACIGTGRFLSGILHRLFPGKLHADALIVGNHRTAASLPRGVRGRVYEVVESGVDLKQWEPKQYSASQPNGIVQYVFCGRFVDWKGARYAVEAFAPLVRKGGVRLHLIGDGELFESVKKQVADLGIGEAVILHGRVPLDQFIRIIRESDVYVMPSLRECGGLALLEAMAIGLPIVATNWMGPAEYLDSESAILVDPVSEQAFVAGFTAAMERLRDSPDLRQRLGQAARERVLAGYFGWEKKVNRVVEVLREQVRVPSNAGRKG